MNPSSSVRSKVVVGVGDLKLSRDPNDLLVTFALGSCIGVTVFDPAHRIGGLLHAMLPRADLAAQATVKPAMFADTGIPELFRGCYALGADRDRLVVCVAGGASRLIEAAGDMFKIGQRNIEMARALLELNNRAVHEWDVGGTHARTLSLDLDTGLVTVRTGVDERNLT